MLPMIATALVTAQFTGVLHLCSDGKTYGNSVECAETVTTSSATPMPECPNGYQLVADLTMHPKCARDVIDPIK